MKKTDALAAAVKSDSPAYTEVVKEAQATPAGADGALAATVQTLQAAVDALTADLAAEARAREELAATIPATSPVIPDASPATPGGSAAVQTLQKSVDVLTAELAAEAQARTDQ